MAISITLPDDTVRKLQQRAAARGTDIETVVKEILLKHINTTIQYRLEDLVVQCDFTEPLSAEDKEWLDSPPVGREII